MLLMAIAVLPVLVNVTGLNAELVSTFLEPKVKPVADNFKAEAVVVWTPMPVRMMLCGDFFALWVSVILADNDPALEGLNWTWIVQLAPAARLAPQLWVLRKDEALAPVSAIPRIVRALPQELDTVTVFAAE